MKGNYFTAAFGLWLLAGALLLAQPQRKVFQKIGVTEGLPEEYARYVVQDQQGYIWIATQNGLVKYDGYELKTYGPNASYSKELKLRNLQALFVDRIGLIWTSDPGEVRGMASFNPRTQSFKHYFLSELDSSLADFNPEALKRDLYGNLWFQASHKDRDSRLIGKLDLSDSTITTYPATFINRYFSPELVNLILTEREADSSLWITSGGHLLRHNREQDHFDTILKYPQPLPGVGMADSLFVLTATGPSGKLTLGSRKSLYVYDPETKSVIYHSSFKEWAEDWIVFPFEDNRGNFWGAKPGKILRINGNTGKADHWRIGEGELKEAAHNIENPAIFPIHLGEDSIWFRWFQDNFFDEKSGFLKFDLQKDAWEVWDDKLVSPDGSPIRAESNILKDYTGLLWIGTRPNLYRENPRAALMDWYTQEDSIGLPDKGINRLHEDAQGRVWVGTQKGLARFDGQGRFITYTHNKSNPGSLSDNRINHIQTDPLGRLWIATDNGVNLWLPESDRFKRFLPGKNILSLFWDSEGDLWMNAREEGMYEMNREGVVKLRISPSDSFPEMTNYPISILEDKNGDIWWADPFTNDKGAFRFVQETQRLEHYYNNPEDPTSLPYNEMRHIFRDRSGNLWFASDGGVLAQFNYDENNFIRYPEFGLHSITCMGQDTEGNYYFGTYSTVGVLKVSKDLNSFETLGEEEGLLHNDIQNNNRAPDYIFTDDSGRFYLTTYRGLSLLDPSTKAFRNFTEADGFHGGASYYRLLKRENGEIWVGSENGLNRIYPEQLDVVDTTLARVWITQITINDSIFTAPDGSLFEEAVPFSKMLELEHEQKDLTIDFVALHYLQPENNLYSWKLENYDNDWSEPSKDRQAKYTNLSPGTYTFRVKGSNANGVWNEEGASIQISINPPWWQTWWAYGVYFLILCFLGYRFHLYQKARTLARAKEEARAKELEQAKEIKKAYAELKATQDQLIQSEKMASLGELTAGIAHEIQNPLNFVNNFSEVNRELIEELKEETAKDLKKRDPMLEQELLTDIDQNLEKIAHHGKRADSIVKGMLQHSRASNGKKEPTDINALADEYLRLAYHGFRAKDKSFNADMETHFDSKIGQISVIPQDIGRVILNLITNAFHAVQEKKKVGGETFKPKVEVSTRKTGKSVQIEVKDNGSGIPEKIIKKIFEPFFTTKPSGRGTGLGLSMSYEIITKGHGGELKVDSVNGEGTTFTIELPVNNENKPKK